MTISTYYNSLRKAQAKTHIFSQVRCTIT